MHYIASKSLGIKKSQDRTEYSDSAMIICDGIGEFENSGKVAELTAKDFILNKPKSVDQISDLILQNQQDIKADQTEGGTTLIYSFVDEETITFAYLGNGAIIQTTGEFAKLPSTFEQINHAYRFVNLFLPHVDENGTLTKHLSFSSQKAELKPDIITLHSERPEGLIYIIASDGLVSLEEQVIISDQQGRKWRNESSSVVIILERLNQFLIENCKLFNSDLLKIFIDETLNEFKLAKELEDDASLGIIISENVISYYKKNHPE